MMMASRNVVDLNERDDDWGFKWQPSLYTANDICSQQWKMPFVVCKVRSSDDQKARSLMWVASIIKQPRVVASVVSAQTTLQPPASRSFSIPLDFSEWQFKIRNGRKWFNFAQYRSLQTIVAKGGSFPILVDVKQQTSRRHASEGGQMAPWHPDFSASDSLLLTRKEEYHFLAGNYIINGIIKSEVEYIAANIDHPSTYYRVALKGDQSQEVQDQLNMFDRACAKTIYMAPLDIHEISYFPPDYRDISAPPSRSTSVSVTADVDNQTTHIDARQYHLHRPVNKVSSTNSARTETQSHYSGKSTADKRVDTSRVMSYKDNTDQDMIVEVEPEVRRQRVKRTSRPASTSEIVQSDSRAHNLHNVHVGATSTGDIQRRDIRRSNKQADNTAAAAAGKTRHSMSFLDEKFFDGRHETPLDVRDRNRKGNLSERQSRRGGGERRQAHLAKLSDEDSEDFTEKITTDRQTGAFAAEADSRSNGHDALFSDYGLSVKTSGENLLQVSPQLTHQTVSDDLKHQKPSSSEQTSAPEKFSVEVVDSPHRIQSNMLSENRERHRKNSNESSNSVVLSNAGSGRKSSVLLAGEERQTMMEGVWDDNTTRQYRTVNSAVAQVPPYRHEISEETEKYTHPEPSHTPAIIVTTPGQSQNFVDEPLKTSVFIYGNDEPNLKISAAILSTNPFEVHGSSAKMNSNETTSDMTSRIQVSNDYNQNYIQSQMIVDTSNRKLKRTNSDLSHVSPRYHLNRIPTEFTSSPVQSEQNDISRRAMRPTVRPTAAKVYVDDLTEIQPRRHDRDDLKVKVHPLVRRPSIDNHGHRSIDHPVGPRLQPRPTEMMEKRSPAFIRESVEPRRHRHDDRVTFADNVYIQTADSSNYVTDRRGIVVKDRPRLMSESTNKYRHPEALTGTLPTRTVLIKPNQQQPQLNVVSETDRRASPKPRNARFVTSSDRISSSNRQLYNYPAVDGFRSTVAVNTQTSPAGPSNSSIMSGRLTTRRPGNGVVLTSVSSSPAMNSSRFSDTRYRETSMAKGSFQRQ